MLKQARSSAQAMRAAIGVSDCWSDGTSDDTATCILNHRFAAAANMSAIIYISFGVYLTENTAKGALM